MTMLAIGTLMYYCQDCSYILIGVLAVALTVYLQWIANRETPLDTIRGWKLFWIFRKRYKKSILQKPDPFGSVTPLVIPTQHDASLEGQQDSSNSISFTGLDVESGSSLYIKVNFCQRNTNKAKVFLQWRDQESSETFILVNPPSSPFVDVEKSGENQFVAAGIHLTVLEPMRRWRILFNGMLKKQSNGEVVHVKMNLIWSAAHSPFDWSSDVSWQPIIRAIKRTTPSVNEESLDKIFNVLHPYGYDQWGTMFGEVLFLDEIEEKKIYMRGLRERRIRCDEENDSKNEFQLIGVTENGFHFVVHQKRLQTSDSSLSFNFGHLLVPGRDILPITDLEIPHFEWHHDLVKKKHFAVQQDFARVKAGDRWFNIGVQMKNEVLETQNESRRFETVLMASDLTFNCRRGRALFFSRNKLLDESEKTFETVKLYEEFKPDNSARKRFVVALNSDICTSSMLTGGKASSLALMLSSKNCFEGVEIPLGVCVTTAGLEQQLRDFPELEKLITEIERQTSKLNCAQNEEEKEKAKHQLEENCKKAVEGFSKGQLSSAVASDLFGNLDQVFSSSPQNWIEKKFAVRSSAVGEDSSDLSSAGQNETFLGCSGKNRIEEAVLKCWASLFAFQSVEYRRQNGQAIKTGMAVVIQEMVAAEAAGVLFTRDPINGDPSKIVITANFGLGESVVSAISDPDTIVIKNRFWESENSLSIESSKIGAKKTRIDMSISSSGTKEEEVDSSEAGKSCLDENIALRLATLGIQLEKKFGSPRDIEFAIKQNKIYLLQSRPITSLTVWSDEDLLHEFDSATFSKEDIATKANLGEVIPGASSPLTNSLMLNCLDLSIQKMMLYVPGNSQAFCPYTRRMIPISYHHCFFNYLDCCLPLVESEEKTAHNVAVDMAVFGHEVTTKDAMQCAVDRRGMGTRLKSYLRLSSVARTVLKTVYWQKYGLDATLRVPLYDVEKLSCMSAKEIYNAISKGADEFSRTCFIHSRNSEASTIFQLIIFLTLAEDTPVSEWSTDLFADAANLLASDAGDVESAGCPTELKILSDAIWECIESQSEGSLFSSLTSDEAEKLLHKKDPKVSKMYQAFLEKFGHRCLREFDLASKPWGEDRGPLLATLQAMVASKSGSKPEDPNSSETGKKSSEQKLDSLQKNIKPGTRKALKFLLPYAHGGVALRENSKSLLIKRVHEMRMAYRCLAKKLCENGYLPEPDLIFYVTHHEIKELLEQRSPTIVQKSVRRRRLRAVWDELRFKEMNHGLPTPIDFESSSWSQHALHTAGLTMAHGTPVCRGRYKGVAKVVTKLADAATIKQGDILITVSTDIGWSPYFPLLGGVATELGGLISHGAVVAREYGLPCVVGVEGATAIFKNGDIVEIDGARGTITKCQEGVEETK